MTKNPYIIYQHLKHTKQGPVYRWYYYYYDQNGKKIQKACKKCLTREQAEMYINALPKPSDIITRTNLIKDIAGDMYLPNSMHVERRRQLGKSVFEGTLKECRRYIKLIINQWGNIRLQDLQPEMVMMFLFSQKKSGKWKNRFIQILNEIYSEAPWYKCRARKLPLKTFKLKTDKASAFTPTELHQLFVTENFPSQQFFILFLLCLAAGLRLGEVRAVRAKQINFEHSLIIIDGFIQDNKHRTDYNKKGTSDNPKTRIVYLNEMIINILRKWISENNIQPDELLFTKDGRPIRKEHAENVFYKALQSAGIIPTPKPRPKNKRGEGRQKQIKTKIKCPDGRKLVPHSLRFTYITMMLAHVRSNELMSMTGHTSEVNVNYYHEKVLDMTIASLPKNLREATDHMFQWEKLKEPPNLETQLELFDLTA